MTKRFLLLLAALAATLTVLVPSASGAIECIRVPGVFAYCPGRHCNQIQPCDVTRR